MVTKEQKEELSKKVIDTLELAKNLSEPRNEQEQKMLDDIYNEIQALDKYLDYIIQKSKK